MDADAIKQGGEFLLNLILQSNLATANRSEEPTFIGPTSINVLVKTLYTSIDAIVENWRVLSKLYFSDQMYIYFYIRSEGEVRHNIRRNPRLGSLQADTIRQETYSLRE